jgi:hypothetical protein
LIGSLFTRFRSETDSSDCAALGDDPEWNELVAWAGVESASAAPAGAESRDEETPASEDDAVESDDWDSMIAQAKATTPAPAPLDEISIRHARQAEAAPAPESEDWDAIIAQAKATTPAPLLHDELSTRRARQASFMSRPQHQPDLGLDAWDIALRRAKQG